MALPPNKSVIDATPICMEKAFILPAFLSALAWKFAENMAGLVYSSVDGSKRRDVVRLRRIVVITRQCRGRAGVVGVEDGVCGRFHQITGAFFGLIHSQRINRLYE